MNKKLPRITKISLAFSIDELEDLKNGLAWARNEGADPDTDVEDKIRTAIQTLKTKEKAK